jgi:hypothetical protein
MIFIYARGISKIFIKYFTFAIFEPPDTIEETVSGG